MKRSSLSIAGSLCVVLAVLFFANCAAEEPVETVPPADLVLTNAFVYTMDADAPTAAVPLRNSRRVRPRLRVPFCVI